jgi:uncharacterized membrane protein YdjX (TVP38/TMEM64 family)
MRSIWIPLIISIAFVSLTFIIFQSLETQFSTLLEDAQSSAVAFSGFSFSILVSDIILPVPSSIILYLNGLVLGFAKGFLLSYSALVLSSIFGYGLGRITSFRKKQDLSKAQAWINQYGYMAIIVSRGIPILSESLSYTAGFNRMKFNRYLISSSLGYLPFCVIFTFFGSKGASEGAFMWSFVASLFLAGVFWFIGKTYGVTKANA